jgi:beta-phosphoglucomutase-like phosphatase (HAD superfamily)
MSVRALLLDFNGTLSRDEPLLCELFHDLFAEQGKPLSEDEYYAQLSGLADREIACTWLGRDDPEVVAEYARRMLPVQATARPFRPRRAKPCRPPERQAPGSPLVSGAPRAAIEAALRGAELQEYFSTVVSAEDVEHGKPDPTGFLRALGLLDLFAGRGRGDRGLGGRRGRCEGGGHPHRRAVGHGQCGASFPRGRARRPA